MRYIILIVVFIFGIFLMQNFYIHKQAAVVKIEQIQKLKDSSILEIKYESGQKEKVYVSGNIEELIEVDKKYYITMSKKIFRKKYVTSAKLQI